MKNSPMPNTLAFTAIILALLVGDVFSQRPDGPRRRRPNSAVLTAIDTDGDRTLSTKEIELATKSLLTLDKNGDANLTSAELAPPQNDRGRGRGRPPFGGRMNRDPILQLLDKDGDGELFDDEITDATISLQKGDKDSDGMLSADELRPERRGFGGRGRRPGPGMGRGDRDGNTSGTKVPKPSELDPKDGCAEIPDRAGFEAMSYQGKEVMADAHLAGIQFVKFQIENTTSDTPELYFMNTKTHRAHPMFAAAMGLARQDEDRMKGVLIYWPRLTAPDGSQGHYTFEFEPFDAYKFDKIKIAFDQLSTHATVVKGKLSYNLLERAKVQYLKETEKYVEAKLPTFEVANRYKDISFLALNPGKSIGILKMMSGNERPSPTTIAIYVTLPNEMPRVAGVITGARQTPLSHVNLRAIQDQIPNAYVNKVAKNSTIQQLLGKHVCYEVNAKGYTIREASAKEVKDHFANSRPKKALVPKRDLGQKKILSFADLGFASSISVGVKAANIAELGKIGLPEGMTPHGYAIPFAFYDEFMKHNGLFAVAAEMVSTKDFRDDPETRSRVLKKFRKTIKKGKMPAAMMTALAAVQAKFPEGSSIRCRSSTNNEDLAGFSGAGLYDSFTHHPREGHLSKSIKQVFASLWNDRAVEARQFYRIDHAKVAMGVAMHLSTKKEKANGVAVTKDVLYGTEAETGRRFYLNAQVGEELITNPELHSDPDELLISPRNPRTDRVIRHSSLAKNGKPVVGAKHLLELRRALRTIHAEFGKRYKVQDGQKFAMEIEFKITRDNKLFIKQARPWVFAN